MPQGPVELGQRLLTIGQVEPVGPFSRIPVEVIRRKKKVDELATGITPFQAAFDIVSVGVVFEAQGMAEGGDEVPIRLAPEFYLIVQKRRLYSSSSSHGYYRPYAQGASLEGGPIDAAQFITPQARSI